jgi:uncharacterized protein YjbI with pentapeptide repeats
MQEIITQSQFIELCKNGQKKFSNSLMQFFDVGNIDLSGIFFEKCDMNFCTFRNCNMKNTVFDRCNIYYGSFYAGNAKNLEFNKCVVEITLFENFRFDDTRFKNSDLRICAFIDSNIASVDMSSSVQFKIITDMAQLTHEDIEYLVSNVMQSIERMDVGLRLKVKGMIRQGADKYSVNISDEKQEYKSSDRAYQDSPVTYGEVKGIVDAFVYGGQKSPYKARHAYETDRDYKN